jgi:hypothetical protein
MFLGDFRSECDGEDRLRCVRRLYQFFSGWNSVIGVASCCELDGLGIRSCWQDYVHMSRPLLGPNQPPVQWVQGFFPGVKEPGCGIDHPPYLAPMLKSAPVRLLSLWALMACYRMNLPFYPHFSVSSVSIASAAPFYAGCGCLTF